MTFQGKWALITGASSGIGEQFAFGTQQSRFITRKQGLRIVGNMLRPRAGSGNDKNLGNQ